MYCGDQKVTLAAEYVCTASAVPSPHYLHPHHTRDTASQHTLHLYSGAVTPTHRLPSLPHTRTPLVKNIHARKCAAAVIYGHQRVSGFCTQASASKSPARRNPTGQLDTTASLYNCCCCCCCFLPGRSMAPVTMWGRGGHSTSLSRPTHKVSTQAQGQHPHSGSEEWGWAGRGHTAWRECVLVIWRGE